MEGIFVVIVTALAELGFFKGLTENELDILVALLGTVIPKFIVRNCQEKRHFNSGVDEVSKETNVSKSNPGED